MSTDISPSVADLLAQLAAEQDGKQRQALAEALRWRLLQLLLGMWLQHHGIK